MRRFLAGAALAVQFFSVFPVRKELPLGKLEVTVMFAALPLLGAVFGSLSAGMLFLLTDIAEGSGLLVAFAVTALSVLLTGGLHLDGLADTGDAFFAYKEKEKRLEIMGDPHIGAFGVMTLLFTILGKFVFIAEAAELVPLMAVAAVPVLSRIGMLLLFSTASSAKPTGLAAFFGQRTDKRLVFKVSLLYLLLIFLVLTPSVGWQLTGGAVLAVLGAFLVFQSWCRRQFGGVTGDLLGAFIEGVELVLWLVILFFI